MGLKETSKENNVSKQIQNFQFNEWELQKRYRARNRG